MDLIQRSVMLVTSLTPERMVFPVLFILGTIVLAPLFVFFYSWSKLFPKNYRRRFGESFDFDDEIIFNDQTLI